jgi:hypothetical protein
LHGARHARRQTSYLPDADSTICCNAGVDQAERADTD